MSEAYTKLIQLLDNHQARYRIIDHPPEGRTEIVSQLRGHGEEQAAKCIVLMVKLGKKVTKYVLGELLASAGRVIVIGSRGDVTITPRDLMARQASVIGMIVWNTPEADVLSIHAALKAGLKNGTLRPKVGLELPLASAEKAHRKIMEPGAFGKIVLVA
jgi:NADPH2:quinone reductase